MSVCQISAPQAEVQNRVYAAALVLTVFAFVIGLAEESEFILSDEATSALDPQSSKQVLADMICKLKSNPRNFTLDTGRLFAETYSLIDRTNMHCAIRSEVFFPECREVERLVAECGMNGFYESLENRKRCCRVRKIEPLRRAFRTLDVWICGLRREQSVTRGEMQLVEWDEANGLVKLNPLIGWHEEPVWECIRKQGVPYNKLHDQVFSSIGC